MWRSPERRGAAYGGPGEASPRQGASMAYGMPADEVAAAVLKVVDERAF